MLKMRGPMIEPCGTKLMLTDFEIRSSIWTNCSHPQKYLTVHLRYDLENPRAFIFSRTDLYFTVSKPFEKSAKTSRVHSLRFIAFNMSSCILNRTDVVEWLFLNSEMLSSRRWWFSKKLINLVVNKPLVDFRQNRQYRNWSKIIVILRTIQLWIGAIQACFHLSGKSHNSII